MIPKSVPQIIDGRLREVEHQPTDTHFSKTKMLPKNNIFGSIFLSVDHVWLDLVNLTTRQVETLVGALEDLSPKLKALGVVEIDAATIYATDSES
jgi:hypothetical protein